MSLSDHIIVEEPSVVYADVEDDQILLFQSTLVADSDQLLDPVWELLSGAWELFDDVEQGSTYYLGGRERKRRWRMI